VRALRVLVLATVTVLLAAAAHALGGGGRPGASAILLAVPPVALGALALTRRRCGAARIGLALLGAQTALHVHFHVLPAAAHGAPRIAPGGHCASAPGIRGAAGLGHASGATGASPDLWAGIVPAPGMLAFHALATLATALLLARGEKLLWALVDRIAPALPGRPARPVAPLVVLPGLRSAERLPDRLLVHCRTVRGPPAPSCRPVPA